MVACACTKWVDTVNKKGMALLELIVAIAVMAMLIGGIMQGLNMTIMGTYKDSRFNTALHLAQSQMEYIKEQPFDQVYPFVYDLIEEVPEGYEMELTVEPSYEHGIPGLQLVTVNVTCESNNVVLRGFKIHR